MFTTEVPIEGVIPKEGEIPKEDESEEESDDYNPDYYDEEGKYIWGEDGVDWEFYDDEDRIAYE